MNKKAIERLLKQAGEESCKEVKNEKNINTIQKWCCEDLLEAIQQGVEVEMAYPYIYGNIVKIINYLSYDPEANKISGAGYMSSALLLDCENLISLRKQEYDKAYQRAYDKIIAEIGNMTLYKRDGSKFAKLTLL